MQTRNIKSLEKSLQQANNKLESLAEQQNPPDPVSFCIETLKFTPTDYQRKVLLDPSQFLCLRWSRQSGKTVTVSAKILWTAITKPPASMAVVAPSHRQSKAIIHRIARLARNLPKGRVLSVRKNRIDFTNGSYVEAVPNNPQTIRGASLNLVYCDEMNFIRDDVELYDAILFTIITTNGTFIASSTPGSRDSVFHKISYAPEYKFSRHHVTWKEAVEPNGPLNRNVLETIRQQMASDPWRWSREMEAEFAESQESFFPLNLLTRAVDESLRYREVTEQVTGRSLYAGLDFGKHRDYSVLAVVEYDPTTKLSTLIHMHRFPLETDYQGVIGYVKRLAYHWNRIVRITTDTKGVGDVVTSEMRNMGLHQTWGITFTAQIKTNILENLHRMMAENRLRLVYDSELFAEMNCEKSEISKSGQLLFSHPTGTHDDRLWALGLACYGLKIALSVTEYHPVAALGKVIKPFFFDPTRMSLQQKPGPPSPVQICWGCGNPKGPTHKCSNST